jgi:hypothetical protein
MSTAGSATTKVLWARMHVEKLEASAEEFRRAHPSPVRSMLGATGDLLFMADADIEIPPTFSHEFGHLVHELRSALDSLVYEMAAKSPRHPGGLDDPRETFFPIRLSKEQFNHACGKALRGVQDDARQFIEAQQPWSRGGEGPTGQMDELWVLNQFWNMDKHRAIPMVVLRADQEVGVQAGPDWPLHPIPQFGSPMFDSGEPLLAIPAHDESVVRFDPRFTLRVALDLAGPGRGFAVETMARRLYDRVRPIVEEGCGFI